MRLNTGFEDNLRSVALPEGSGDGALVGGENGIVLTYVGGRFEIAQPGDGFGPATVVGDENIDEADVTGLVILPGPRPGETEAWAALQAPSASNERTPAPSEVHPPLRLGSGRPSRPLASAYRQRWPVRPG